MHAHSKSMRWNPPLSPEDRDRYVDLMKHWTGLNGSVFTTRRIGTW